MSSMFAEMMDLVLFDEKPGLVLASDLSEILDPGPAMQRPNLPELFPAQCEVKTLPYDEKYLDAMQDEILTTRPERLLLWPPFTNPRTLSPELRDRFGRLGVQEIALRIATDKAPHGTNIGVILPRQSLIGYAPSRFREHLREQAALRLVIAYEDFWGVIGWPVSIVQMTTLVLTVGAEADDVLRFFRCPSPSEVDEKHVVSDLERLLRQGGGKTEFGYVLREAPRPDAPLSYDLHHPDLAERRDEMVHFGELRRLGELVVVRRGLRPGSKDDLPKGSSTRGVPFVEPRDIRLDGTLVPQDTRYRIEVSPRDQLKTRDICLRSLVDPAAERLAVADITEDVLPLAASSNVIFLRPKLGTTDEDRELLLAYLRSRRALELLRARTPAPVIPAFALADLPVPVPDEALSLAINGLKQAGEQFSEWQAELAHERDSLFALFDAFSTVEDARMHLLSIGRTARHRVDAAAKVTTFSNRVRTLFPHPIAYRWRVTEVHQRNLEGYQELLECTEAVLCYLACMAIVLSRNVEGAKIGYLSTMTKRISEDGQGTNLGDWIAILREARDSRKFRGIPELVSFFEVLHFLEDEEVDNTVQALKDRRDDQAHGRGPKGLAVEPAFDEATADLRTLMKAIEFSSEYPLRYIESTERDSIEDMTLYAYRDLMGDHPLVPLHQATTRSPDVEKGSLYLTDRTGELHLLRPLLTRHRCQVCGRPAVFHLDRYEQDGDVCLLKSLERGHTIKDGRIAQVFRRANLLVR